MDKVILPDDMIQGKPVEVKSEKPKEISTTFGSDKLLLISIVIIVILAALLLVWINSPKPVVVQTIDDLHLINLQGDLDPEFGYVHGGFSFVYFDNLWYTQLATGNVVYDIPHHYGPRDLTEVEVVGKFNSTLFNKNQEIYITFDPEGEAENFKYMTLAIGEFDQSIVTVFNKLPIASCDKPAEACIERPIVTCENKSLSVLYVKEAADAKVILNDNCLIVQGQGLDIVKALDRLLMILYGIM